MITRRDFLKLTGVAAAGVATGAVAELMKGEGPWLERLDLIMDRELWDKAMYRWRLIIRNHPEAIEESGGQSSTWGIYSEIPAQIVQGLPMEEWLDCPIFSRNLEGVDCSRAIVALHHTEDCPRPKLFADAPEDGDRPWGEPIIFNKDTTFS